MAEHEFCRKSLTGRYRSFNSDIANYQLSRSESRYDSGATSRDQKSHQIEMRQSTVGSDGSIIFDNSEKFENLSKTESALELAYRLKPTG